MQKMAEPVFIIMNLLAQDKSDHNQTTHVHRAKINHFKWEKLTFDHDIQVKYHLTMTGSHSVLLLSANKA